MGPVKKALAIQFKQMRINSSRILRGYAVESLHDLRVAALRVQFALNFFRKFIDIKDPHLLRGKLKRARRIMGKARDLDILSSRLGKDFPGLKIMKVRVRRNLSEMLKSAWYEKLLGDLEQSVSYRDKERINPDNLLNKAFHGVVWKKDISRPGDFHKIRISFKNLHYACDFLADFYDKKEIQNMINDIVGFQNVLGEHQDAKISIRILTQLKRQEKSAAIDRFIETEKDRVRNAGERFIKMWKKFPPGLEKK